MSDRTYLLRTTNHDNSCSRESCLHATGMLLTVLTAVPTLVIGVIYMNYCPWEPMLPIFLIVTGCILLAYFICTAILLVCHRDLLILNCVSIVLYVIWNIAGLKWTFSTKHELLYCSQVVLIYSICFLLLLYVLPALLWFIHYMVKRRCPDRYNQCCSSYINTEIDLLFLPFFWVFWK